MPISSDYAINNMKGRPHIVIGMKVNDKTPFRHSREGGNPSLFTATNRVVTVNVTPSFTTGFAGCKAA